MKIVEVLQGARNELAEVEVILDETARKWDEKHIHNLSLEKELDFLIVQIGNVAQSARDFKRHMVEDVHN